MDLIDVWGKVALQGKVKIQGSKNAALPILAATLLVEDISVIRNCPRITDVYAMLSLLDNLGCIVSRQGDGVVVDASKVRRDSMSPEAVRGMRSSLCLLGALLGRCGEVVMEHPGGCVIGERPIDMHISALEQMGATFTMKDGKLKAVADSLHGAKIHLSKPSVGVTENVILAAVLAEGNTILTGAAREPEVQALCSYLQQCGARMEGVGTQQIEIWGGSRLSGTDYTIIPDRIVAGTYLLACIGTGGTVLLEHAPVADMDAVLQLSKQMGGTLYTSEEGLFVQGPEQPKAVGKICTECYPGFPTDLQSVALAVETISDGETIIEETIFENRFRVVEELQKMGAEIQTLDQRRVLVRGVQALRGTELKARELRGGASLVTAGLMATGKTRISGCSYIYRGYESICRDFKELGARIISV